MNIRKALWFTLGMISLGVAYIGFILPGLPFSVFLVGAAFCFARSSERMHAWLFNHPWFGEFLTNWSERRVFPTRLKYAMIAVMASTVAITYFTTGIVWLTVVTAICMAGVALWAWQYPGSVEEHERRKQENL